MDKLFDSMVELVEKIQHIVASVFDFFFGNLVDKYLDE